MIFFVASRAVICQSQRLRQMIRETLTNHNILRYQAFIVLPFYHQVCFHIKKPAKGSCLRFFIQEHGYSIYAWVEYYLQQNTLEWKINTNQGDDTRKLPHATWLHCLFYFTIIVYSYWWTFHRRASLAPLQAKKYPKAFH